MELTHIRNWVTEFGALWAEADWFGHRYWVGPEPSVTQGALQLNCMSNALLSLCLSAIPSVDSRLDHSLLSTINMVSPSFFVVSHFNPSPWLKLHTDSFFFFFFLKLFFVYHLNLIISANFIHGYGPVLNNL